MAAENICGYGNVGRDWFYTWSLQGNFSIPYLDSVKYLTGIDDRLKSVCND